MLEARSAYFATLPPEEQTRVLADAGLRKVDDDADMLPGDGPTALHSCESEANAEDDMEDQEAAGRVRKLREELQETTKAIAQRRKTKKARVAQQQEAQEPTTAAADPRSTAGAFNKLFP